MVKFPVWHRPVPTAHDGADLRPFQMAEGVFSLKTLNIYLCFLLVRFFFMKWTLLSLSWSEPFCQTREIAKFSLTYSVAYSLTFAKSSVTDSLTKSANSLTSSLTSLFYSMKYSVTCWKNLVVLFFCTAGGHVATVAWMRFYRRRNWHWCTIDQIEGFAGGGPPFLRNNSWENGSHTNLIFLWPWQRSQSQQVSN